MERGHKSCIFKNTLALPEDQCWGGNVLDASNVFYLRHSFLRLFPVSLNNGCVRHYSCPLCDVDCQGDKGCSASSWVP